MLGLARLLRLASISICLIVIVSFAVFAIDQTSKASHHQQEVLRENGVVPAPGSGASSSTAAAPAQSTASAPGASSASVPGASQTHAPGASSGGENGVHKALDDVSNQLTSPFSGLISGSSSEWAVRGVKLLLTLVVYGFGLGYIARVIRVRV